ncbi:recombinase family protein [Saccharopolyspora phatthalungensis]|uniref:Recombinase domain-containing protein n=1 Tax=Saccharopolyspora phatthalungensis TaxID=664693 RepID=A0A840PSS7_9PSEU|nr:recombinase family protein [Saccharopolyspora phatthalungensis]MBB5153332.1 hypothetical protein [Saccharopolyspora phatthalungensis]
MTNGTTPASPAIYDKPLGEPRPAGRAVIYLRVSSKRQVGRDYDPEGISIPAQRAACHRKAAQLGLTIADEYVEPGRSGTEIAKRSSFQRMLGRIRDSGDADHVIVYKLSRLAAAGDVTLAQLSEQLHHQRQHTRPTRGHPQQVSISKLARMLRDRYYLGYITYRGEELPGRHEPIIEQDLFDRVQAVLDARTTNPNKHDTLRE